ncbi:protein bunched, class 1/class 3/D/E isoforms-like isoform X3 [Bombyx mandarina]|uniref:Protein bunched, class 1/class 3/D/E isoforms-like isoform X3 n=1 Tax=Bombyx mandarina TaxID=7092 RepID=A0A6J2JHC8_BOMMA|nr:protein bunched, class 1/class 3/D/E isoforms-like isoform X3 [Bombyx mandarina]
MSAATPEVRAPPGDATSPAVALPRIKPDLDLNDATLFAVYCFIKNFIGASGTSAVAIDNKIEQAMDLVKSHLMFAVREEVEVLKERIAELMERITQLEVENTYLRAHASQDTLAQLPAAQGNKPAAQPQPPVS